MNQISPFAPDLGRTEVYNWTVDGREIFEDFCYLIAIDNVWKIAPELLKIVS
jgi:hypothetical protein